VVRRGYKIGGYVDIEGQGK